MGFFGRLFRSKALAAVGNDARGGWVSLIRESFAGAWQQNIRIDRTDVLAFHAVFSCVTLIAGDIAKLRIKLVERKDGIWQETANPAYSPVLRQPNPFQNSIQFLESWVLSKLTNGNTYLLKQRDNRNVVTALYVLDPRRVVPLISDSGAVFYQLSQDNLSGVPQPTITVPAREIIHDRHHCIFHPLVGISPIWASGLAATQGLQIQRQSTRFFGNGGRPSGVLTAPQTIDQGTATRLKEHWEQNYGGENVGAVAVLGSGLKFEPMTMPAEDAQLVEQLKWSGEVVCSTFHVPPYKVGLGSLPAGLNIQALNVEYYSQALQGLIEAIETCLDGGLNTGPDLGVELDVDNLLRMDSVTQMAVLKDGVAAGIYAPNEGRAKIDLSPKPGGDSPYLQQQNYSLAALAKRDAQENPFASAPSAPPAATPIPTDPPAVDPTKSADDIYAGLGTGLAWLKQKAA